MRSEHIAIFLLLGGLAWLGACSLTSDLNDLTDGTTSGGLPTGVGGSGGQGGSEPCTSASDCPQANSACENPICLGGECGFIAAPAGTELPAAEQTANDCIVLVCDGQGGIDPLNDDTDMPADTDCAAYACISGVLDTTPAGMGEACGADWHCDGAGSCVECNTPTDCLPPANPNCGERFCTAGACAPTYVADSTPLPEQNEGDCLVRVCDGQGGDREDRQDTDEPNDDNPCTDDTCEGGEPTFTPVDEGTECAAGICNDQGQCVGCITATDCGDDTPCRQWECQQQGPDRVCLVVYQLPGWPLPGSLQTEGDCQRLVCGPGGAVLSEDYNTDLPPDEPNECTDQQCASGEPVHEPTEVNTDCTVGGAWCDGLGHCVECNDAEQCPLTPICTTRTCNSHLCGTEFTPDGTPTSSQIEGDCHVIVCDGQGDTRTDVQDSDLPVDGNDCTSDICDGGDPSNPPTGAGTGCAQAGGHYCDGAGNCVECTADGHCSPADYCANYDCVPDRLIGSHCDRSTMCTTGYCVDGFCCDSRCDGFCHACAGAMTDDPDGVCGPIRDLTDPENECDGALLCYQPGCCDPSPGLAPPASQPQKEPIPVGPCP